MINNEAKNIEQYLKLKEIDEKNNSLEILEEIYEEIMQDIREKKCGRE